MSRHTPRITSGRKRMLLEAIARLGSINAACQATGISRSSHYEWMERDPAYVVAMREAEDMAVEAMEAEARRRAVLGTSRPVYQGGKHVGDVTEYSDSLMVFLLKALRPEKYRERVDLTVDIRREAEKLAAEAGLDTEALIAEAERLIAASRASG